MAKKDDLIIQNLLKIVADNTKAYAKLANVIQEAFNPASWMGARPQPAFIKALEDEAMKQQDKLEEEFPKPLPIREESKPAQETPEVKPKPKVIVKEEEIRKALMDVDKAGEFRQEAIDLLERFDAKVFKDIKESDYGEFLLAALVILDTREHLAKDKPEEEADLI